jgi:phosphoribosylformimino-5-aminoimidazole carboxamide ribotide isomerase
MDTIQTVLDAGADRVILGTAAHRNPGFLAEAATRFPGRIVAGIDARHGKVALSGWYETTDTDAIEFARRVETAGASRIIFTDISSDGMMGGADVEATRAVARAVGIPVTASGGISSLDDVRALTRVESDGIDEIIIGRALYLDTFTLPQAIAAAGEAT